MKLWEPVAYTWGGFAAHPTPSITRKRFGMRSVKIVFALCATGIHKRGFFLADAAHVDVKIVTRKEQNWARRTVTLSRAKK